MKEIKDHYFFKAKKEGYPARSVYKLIEAQQKFRFLKPGQRILDLGSSPGSWTKYASKVVGPKGLVVSIDLHRLKVSGPNIFFIQADMFNIEISSLPGYPRPFDVVLSDMAPKTTGRRDRDHYLSIELASGALDMALKTLTSSGAFYCKVFDGEDLPPFREELKKRFKTVRLFKPKSSRSESVEKFFFCQGKKE